MAGINTISQQPTPVTNEQNVTNQPAPAESAQLQGIPVKRAEAPSDSPVQSTATDQLSTRSAADPGQSPVRQPETTPEALSTAAAAAPQPQATRTTTTNPADGSTPVGGVTARPATPSTPTSLQVVGDQAFRDRVAQDLNEFAPGTTVDNNGFVRAAEQQIAGHDSGYELVNQILNNPNKVQIAFTPDNAFTRSLPGAQGTPSNPNVGSQASVEYDPNLDISLPTQQPDGTIKDEPIPSSVVLAHELVHAAHAQRGTIDRTNVTRTFNDGDQQFQETWRFEEFRTTGFQGFRQGSEPSENSIRAELGLNPRATYLDRSAWRPVNGTTDSAATRTATDNVSNSWQAGGMCNCFGCGRMAS